MSRASPFEVQKGGVSVHVRVTPKAGRNEVRGVKETPTGVSLSVSVTAVPEGGKANQAVIKLLAKEWKMAKGDIDVTSGTTSRDKTLTIAGDPARVLEWLTTWLEERHG